MPATPEDPALIEPMRLEGILTFIQAAEQLKDTLRSGRTRRGRAESTAEHSWRLCLMALMFERELARLDMAQLLKLLVVHDLGEAIAGDTPAVAQHADPYRAARERADLIALCQLLPIDLRDAIVDLWDEYAAGRSPEAVIAKGLDKIETMMQHLIGRNDPDFDYAFNLTYGITHTDKHPLLRQIRGIVDAHTAERVEARTAR
ncbi:HD domain-containing protein [Sphingomonas psychrotolerans]|uniref:HD domain-containing protein n=1 Tax=Sphingomonas psychrotolerans TaxID=1327635 RepID=A0ABU3N3E4_9SPHN|nr:HD domain-containing protein [Sphingomonas psychrotolerans]MDT8758786.1 HD domain-containing protein [Sphingomonas psychrotolerans]